MWQFLKRLFGREPAAAPDPASTPRCEHCGSAHTVYVGESSSTAEAKWKCNDCGYEFFAGGWGSGHDHSPRGDERGQKS